MNLAMCNLPPNMKTSSHKIWQTFIFETSPNTKPKEKKVGEHGILYPPPEKVGGNVPRVPHQIAPMCEGNLAESTLIVSIIV